MIIKISPAGNHAGGHVKYMASKGNHSEHTNQRTIAGGTVHYDGPLDKATVDRVIADLQTYQTAYPDVHVKGGSIWQCSIAVKPEEGPISDETWGGLAKDFMEGMRFVGDEQPEVRWAIFGHGESVHGNPHCHIIMNRIDASGRKVDTYRDMVKARALAPQLEAKYGLKILESRLSLVGAGSVPYTSKDVALARKADRPEPERVTLEREIRALAAASTSEAEFVRRARGDGIMLRPYPGGDGPVSGYSVAEPAAKPLWFAGRSLATDLSLPQLRRSWPDSGNGAKQATAEWRHGTADNPVVKAGRETKRVTATPATLAAVGKEMAAVGERIKAASPTDLADLSHDLAGTLAAASKALEKIPGPLAKASREVGAWAQPRHLSRDKRSGHLTGRGVALLLVQAMDPGSQHGQAIMLRQLMDMAMALHRLHCASRAATGTERNTRKMTAEPDGFDDAMNDGLTVAVTVGAHTAMHWANSKAEQLERGDSGVSEAEFAGMDDQRRAEVADKPLPPRNGPWTAATIREDRVAAEVAKAKAAFVPPPPRSTLEQQERIGKLAERFDLPLVREAAAGLSQAEAAKLITEFEVSTKDWKEILRDPLPDVGVKSATHIGEIKTSEQAEAFLAHLERRAVARGNPTETASAAVSAAPTSPSRKKDPRTWQSAGDPVTTLQHNVLIASGFTAKEIATLNKGAAGYIIDYPRDVRRAAFDRNAADGVKLAPQPRQARSERAATDVRKHAQAPSIDIRHTNKRTR